MAENEIPRWAQAALERNQRIQSKARSAVALMKLMEEQDRLSRLAPDTLGTVDPNYSEEVRYEAPGAIRDPESWLNSGLETIAGNAADVIFGEESGNPVIDYGVSNIPGVGAVAIGAGGGKPGMVDLLGGIGAPLKGMAVIAKPLASKIIRNASYTTGQDLGMDAARNVARNVIDRMARIQGDVTGDEIYPFISDEMRNLGLVGARDEARIKELATGFAEDTYLRALEDLESGRTPSLNLVLPEKENIAYKPLFEGASELSGDEPFGLDELFRTRARKSAEKARKRDADDIKNLSDAEREEIERRTQERFEREYSPERYKQIPSMVFATMRTNERKKYLAEKRKANEDDVLFTDLGKMELSENSKKIASSAGSDAYKKALAEAISAGYDTKKAQEIASSAQKRASYYALKTDSKAWEESRKRRIASNNNRKLAYELLHPSIKEEIRLGMQNAGEEARKKAVESGVSGQMLNQIAGHARDSYKKSKTLEILKAIGLNNANDPRLLDYEVIGRTPSESILKAIIEENIGE